MFQYMMRDQIWFNHPSLMSLMHCIYARDTVPFVARVLERRRVDTHTLQQVLALTCLLVAYVTTL